MNYKHKHMSTCLVCNHNGFVYHNSKEDYQEVTVCPKCNGAFVDDLKLHKYGSSKKQIEIAMTNPNKPPMIKLDGEPIKSIVSFRYGYMTDDDKCMGNHFYELEYYDAKAETVKTVSASKIN